MTGFVTFLHALLSILLVVIILMQSGRGGGLTEGFASAESMFGAQTNEFMIKATTIFASLFLITSLGLAVLSAQTGKSLMAGSTAPEEQIPSGKDVLAPIGSEEDSAVTVSEVEKLRESIDSIPIETGAEESIDRALDALPSAAIPEIKPKAEPPAKPRQVDVPAVPIPDAQ